MFDFANAPVPIRGDIGAVYSTFWSHLASPGASLTGYQRVSLASSARSGQLEDGDVAVELQRFAAHLSQDPATVTESDVRAASDGVGDPATVETIAIVCHLAAVDAFHRALGLGVPSLPEPREGRPTGEVTPGLMRRNTHVPVPPGPIPVTLDLVPAEGRMLELLAGPQYMTYADMAFSNFARTPGLDRAQMELISSRLSFHNECFY